jgi:Uma2 family endonuclease
MATLVQTPDATQIVYPESDGLPMSDNTEQFDWITLIKFNLEAQFAEDADVFVAADLLWYPVEGDPKTRQAPDAMVAFGRPKGKRGSYQQWKEGGIAPQVVFEVLSPGNTASEMTRKYGFYERHGVEEYYVLDPERGAADGWTREGEYLVPVEEMNGWTSPRLGVRFEVAEERVRLFRGDGKPFEDYIEVMRERERAERRAEEACRQAEEASRQAEEAGRRAEAERQARLEADQRAQRLAAKLREMGVDPNGL